MNQHNSAKRLFLASMGLSVLFGITSAQAVNDYIEASAVAVTASGNELQITLNVANDCGSSIYVADKTIPLGAELALAATSSMDMGSILKLQIGTCQGDKAVITAIL